MNKADLENFKNSLLFDAIHKEERSDYLWEVIDKARAKVLTKYELHDGDWPKSSFYLYVRMIVNVERLKNLIMVCNDLQSNGYKLKKLVAVEENHYQNLFKHRIEEAKKVMNKLRPLILEYTKNWTMERKLKESNDPVLGPYFKGWYL